MRYTVSSIVMIRQRGQLTIPYEIRKDITWLRENSVITLTVKADEEIIIRPYVPEKVKNTD